MKLPSRLAPTRIIRHRRLHRLNPEEVLLQKEAWQIRFGRETLF